jgi:bifunctional UDP-N-acetylglucosamine pyrophosphorylase/glucosamine-1-phosphate N-acetyltransferase
LDSAVILAAGKGKRMQSGRSKQLHEVCGRPMVKWVVDAAREAGIQDIAVVLGRDADAVARAVGSGVRIAYQDQQLGTGHACMMAEDLLKGESGTVIVLFGDSPLMRPETIKGCLAQHRQTGATATLLTADVPNPTGYGRVIRGEDGRVLRIIEEKDTTPEQKKITEVFPGTLCVERRLLFGALHQLKNNNAQGEYYLTDLVELMSSEGRVETYLLEDNDEMLGVNDRIALAQATGIMQRRINEELMLAGVTLIQPANVVIQRSVRIGRDTVIYPGCVLEGDSEVGERCVLMPGTHLKNSRIGSDVTVEQSVLWDTVVGDGCQIGPFAYMRPGTHVADNVKIGDFVEIKNSYIGKGTKVPHLCYVGDADVGARVNMGCGSILVNYDGVTKHRSTIADGAFIGCNVNLVSPVHVGRRAYVAAGSTVTDDVPDEALAIARCRQANKEGWVAKNRPEAKEKE